jgi:hypothetical protein
MQFWGCVSPLIHPRAHHSRQRTQGRLCRAFRETAVLIARVARTRFSKLLMKIVVHSEGCFLVEGEVFNQIVSILSVPTYVSYILYPSYN